jgi:hypothetical protein
MGNLALVNSRPQHLLASANQNKEVLAVLLQPKVLVVKVASANSLIQQRLPLEPRSKIL